MKNIKWNIFKKIEIRVGTIIKVEDFPEAIKPAYQLKVDFGEEIGIKKSSAQITDLYSKDSLIGKQVVVIVNLPPKKIGPFISECLITGFYNKNKSVVLTIPDKNIPFKLIEASKKTCVIGLICDVTRLSDVRRNRIQSMHEDRPGDYTNEKKIINELENSKKLYKKYHWPVIDVTRKSVEETAASIIKILDILSSR